MTQASAIKDAEMIPYAERPYFSLPRREWALPVAFMLSLSLWGLSFYPAIVLVFFLIVYAARHDRESMIIMLMLVAGGYGYISEAALVVKNIDIILPVSFVLSVIYVKPPIVSRTLRLFWLYAAALLVLALFSVESLSVQLLNYRYYLSFIFFIIPVVSFAGKEFDMSIFFQRAIQFGFIAAFYYIVDSLILGANVFTPHLFNWSVAIPTFLSPGIKPLSILRQYPPGLYILFFAIYPLARIYRLKWWQWAFLLLSILVTQTSTLLLTFVVVFMLCQGRLSQLFKWSLGALAAFAVLFAVDSVLPRSNTKDNESMLRIRSTYDQFVNLFDAADIEDISKFASGRMAQIIPKVELVVQEHKQLTGLGFIHREKTKILKYIIHNEYYTNVEIADEVATGVECAPVQVWLTVGWIGLAVHILFLWGLWYVIRRLRYSMYFVSVMLCSIIMGLSGWCMPISPHGLIVMGLAYSVVLLANIDKSER